MGYGIKIFVPRPLHYVTRSPGYNHLSYQLVPESTEGESTLANDEQEWTLFEVGLAGNSDSFDFYIMDATMIWRPSALPFGVLITRG